MDPSTVAFIKGIVAFVVVATVGMAAVQLYFRIRAGSRSDSNAAIDALKDEHARLEAEMASRMAELEDRVDFVERRLVQGRPPTNLPPRPERTPV